MRLKLRDVQFDRGSVVDPAGRIFHHDGRVFRAISDDQAQMYRRFLEADCTQDIFDAGLIETWISDIELEGYQLVLEHRKVPVLSCWSEWCSEMIKDATTTICRLNLELCKRGYITKDTQPGNVQFIDGRAHWIDFGSIVPLGQQRSFAFDEFRYHSFLPLWLMSHRCPDLGRHLYQEVGKGYAKQSSSRRGVRWIPPKYALIKHKALHGDTIAALEDLLDYIAGLSVKPTPDRWSVYGQGGMPPVGEPSQFGEKAQAVYRLLQPLAPGLLLDVAGNKGWYAELAASMGHRAISFDTDDASVCNLYQRVREARLPVLPLVLDFRYPSAPYSIGLGKEGAFDRLRSDVVLVLALVHHLVFGQNMFFEPIVEIIARYTRKHAIVEFVPKEDRYVREWFTSRHHWYSMDNFIQSLRHHFSVINIHDSWPAPRKLLFCSK